MSASLSIQISCSIRSTRTPESFERRHERSCAKRHGPDCFLSLQTLSEFFASTTRKGKLTAAEASTHVEDWQTLFPVVAATPGSLRLAMRAVQQHSLSFWDAMQWAVAKQAGATLLLSEDLQHDRVLEGVRFRNPFLVDDPFGS
ncbi:MAG: PIN domain-containing protein [Thermoanaerobaculia bacterium]